MALLIKITLARLYVKEYFRDYPKNNILSHLTELVGCKKTHPCPLLFLIEKQDGQNSNEKYMTFLAIYISCFEGTSYKNYSHQIFYFLSLFYQVIRFYISRYCWYFSQIFRTFIQNPKSTKCDERFFVNAICSEIITSVNIIIEIVKVSQHCQKLKVKLNHMTFQ